MTTTPSGGRRVRVTIKQENELATLDDGGDLDLTDEDNQEFYCRRWAKIAPRGGREFFRRDEIEARVTHLVYLPYDTDTVQITPEMWLELDGPAGTTRRLNIIHAINVGEMNREIELQCEEQK